MTRKTLISTYFFCIIALASSEVSTNTDDKDTVDRDTLLQALGTSKCVKECTSGLINVVPGLFTLTPSMALNVSCREYEKTQGCLKKQPHCQQMNIFETATSGLELACGDRRKLFAVMEKCLDEKAPHVVTGCEAKCDLNGALVNISKLEQTRMAAAMGGNLFIMAQNIGPLCRSLTCTLPCFHSGLNDVCPLSGYYLIDTVLTPLDKAAVLLGKLTPVAKDVIMKKLPASCHPLVNKKSLAELRRGTYRNQKKSQKSGAKKSPAA